MSIELGHFAFVLAFAISVVSALAGLTLWRRGDRLAMALSQASVLQFILIAAAFAALVQAFVVSDFSVALVVNNSHSLKPLIFKISGVWGNHEGSMLLWILILVLFGALVAAFGRRLPSDLTSLVLGTQSLLVAAFSGFTLFTSNPFARVAVPPLEGNDLNPILQDIGLAIHPPLLYAGYVGFSICFSFAIAALISGRIDQAWARWVRPWTMLSWIFLTLGIAMGSYWAYYELGWGGWWFWDPVENASFMPWLAGTALLHSALVMEKRNALKVWTVFLSIITFSLSLLGTFLVRSGILTSVHTFASDPTRGLVILSILAVLIGSAFLLFAIRSPALRQGGLFAPISREGALILNNLFLATAVGAVLVGTLYPLLLDALTGTSISVGAPFFDFTFGALMAPLLLVLPFGPLLPWKRGDMVAAGQRLVGVAALAIFLTILISALGGVSISLVPLGLLLGFWVSFGSIAEVLERGRVGRIPVSESVRRLVGLPRSIWSTAIGHLGLGLTVLGVVSVTAWETELVTTLNPGETAELSGYTIHFESFEQVPGPNYMADTGIFTVTDAGGGTARLEAERRIYAASGMPTTEAAIQTYGLSQLYLQLGEPLADTHVIRVWHKPYILLIWLGALVMAGAGVLSLTDRRLRIGAPNKAARPSLKAAE
ncbi:heme lyase CcmF/NrfE family subunit [Devosia sp. 63-57]|uniref:heme lyase CcmF/NrfE family subunit n=1 Tax=Devosia sp. 63-57 TaxID=1895751 RepID=UPI00086F7980|nr:heme lyase CcmF/NrfE family subunit [Devosia sp. 63-57]ODT47370.1 MAG: c-type cytochrome biogenesis protein CcmF [Pelagibacterium sp. SCN 63-126]ODU87047.1 MAG: c-type cytochrome biogenesis protein CcmF [Pelagibacterium sp. SCN 63-17]OJX42922.1 MAG: c-type cytochrome biogenesis protein CcmF [Devosia sp. 63-57]